MKIKYFCLTLVFGLSFNIAVEAQTIHNEVSVQKLEETVKGIWWAKGYSGESGLQITVRGGKTSRLVIPDAKIMIISGKDTINMVTNESGMVTYDDRLLKDSVELTVSYPGRETVSGVIKIPAIVQAELEKKDGVEKVGKEKAKKK